MEDDFTNKSLWKKQVSQDGREYYVNLVTGTIKYPPKQSEKKFEKSSTPSPSAGHSDDHYIQQYTVDKVPFFVNMRSGVSLWTLPEGTPLTAVKYITHLTAEGIPYYEDTEKKTTSWTLPVEKLSTSARRSSVALVKMNRRQSNVFMASINPETNTPQVQTQQTTIEEDPKENETNHSDGEGGRSDGDGGLFKPRVRNRPTNQAGAKKSTTQPRRLSNMAQKSQQNVSTENQKEAIGMNDARAIRANQRQQSISKLTTQSLDDGNDSDQSNESNKLTKKPFAHDPNRDSPTISDVSSVTVASHPAPSNTGNHETVTTAIETKPLVRTMFEKYEKNKSGWISSSGLQELCYDFGTFLSQDELKLAISEIDMDRDGRLSYEEFMVWWRTNDQFSTMKLNDAHTKMRTDCAAVYKRYDKKMGGEVSRQEFAKIHRELVREKLVKIDLDSLVSILDPKGDGVVYFNDFISWVERGQTQPSGKTASEAIPKQKSLAKFFGSLLGGGSQEPEPKIVADSNLVQAKDHQDYAKYFRMASMGGNLMDIRKQMREAGLDENIIQTPEKQIPKQSKLSQNDHLKQATMRKGETATFGSLLNSTDFQDDESDGKSTVASSVHVDDRQFTGMFKKKLTSRPSLTIPTLIEVYLSKPLGITLGENVEDEEKGVHVSSCAPGGNAANTGVIEPGMLLIEACGEDVRFRDFDSVMDILRGAPAGEKIKLLFSKPVEVPQMAGDDEAGDSDVSETSSVDKSIQSFKSQALPPKVNQADPNDSDASETSSVDKSVKASLVPESKSIISIEPDDSDESETSSVDRSLVRGKSPIQPESARIEPDFPKRRDSNKSVESVASTTSHVSQTSKTSQTSVASKVSVKSNVAQQPSVQSQNSPVVVSKEPVSSVVEEKSSVEEKPTLVSSNISTQPSGRSSFAMRKAAAIRNAAARRNDTPKVPQEIFSSQPSVTQPENPSASSSLPRGIFGISHNSSDSDSDEAPPMLPNSAHEKLSHFESHEWKGQEPVVSIPNPHLSIHQESQSSPELPSLENSEIIGRPRAPRKNLPSILNRMKRQQSNESTNENKPERGGIARMGSRPIPESLLSSDPILNTTVQLTTVVPAVPLHQPTMTSAMSDIGSTGTGKVPLPASLFGNMGQVNTNQGKEVVSNPITDRVVQQNPTSIKDIPSHNFQSFPSQQTTQAPFVDVDSEHHSPTQDFESPASQRTRRATPLGRHRGMRKFASKQSTLAEGSDTSKSQPEKSSVQALTIPSPQTITKQRREELSSRNQVVDSDGDSEQSFSPHFVHKTLAPYHSHWDESVLSVPKLGTPGQSNNLMSRSDLSESESSQSQSHGGSRGYLAQDIRQTTQTQSYRTISTARNVRTVDVGVQSDYVAYIDEQYLNSYQMLLGERQKLEYMQEVFRIECEERLDMLHEEELSMMDRIRRREEESYQRMHEEEDHLSLRVQEVEEIILNEKEEIHRQWDDLHHAENASHEAHHQRTTELLELLHIVRAHHDKLQADKKKIGRQRLQLDMALQDLNKFNHFNPSPEGKLSRHNRQNYSPSARSTSPAPYPSQNSIWSHGRPASSPSRAPSRERSFGSTR